MFFTGIIVTAIESSISFGGIVAFIILIWIYREMFRLKWLKAILVWFLHGLFILLLKFLVGLLIVATGVTALAVLI